MALDFTHDDVIQAAIVARKAVRKYARRRRVCADCLTAYAVPALLHDALVHSITENNLPNFHNFLDSVWNAAMADRKDGIGLGGTAHVR